MLRDRISTDVVVIGAGPAGLAAAQALRDCGTGCIVIEAGHALDARDHDNSKDIVRGVGGCGLFSDGKFSFFPSATRLWSLKDKDASRSAWDWFADQLRAHGLIPPQLPLNTNAGLLDGGESDSRSHEKPYPSLYLPFAKRLELIREFQNTIEPSLRSDLEAATLAIDSNSRMLLCQVAHTSSDHVGEISARAAVIATGRFGPIQLRHLFADAPMVFRRFEIGVRIEQNTECFFLSSHPALDPKVIISGSPGIEWRTFCCCRSGEVVHTDASGLLTVSGRADGQSLGCSNVGFNLRLTDPRLAEAHIGPLLARMAELRSPIRVTAGSFLKAAAEAPTHAATPLGHLFGPEITELLAQGLHLLQQHAPSLDFGSATLIGPALEGVGWYPRLTEDLIIAPLPVWVAGDCTGLFRGLTAALVSGYYCGLRAASCLEHASCH